MKTVQLAKDDRALGILDDWHSRFEDKLEFSYETRRVETKFGFTDIVVTGEADDSVPNDETPIIILHGAMAGAPFALGEICDLPSRRKLIALNIPGQSTRAAHVRLDFRTDEYGQWFEQILDDLGIEKAIVCGISWGGSVALRIVQHAANRVSGLILIVPGSIVKGPLVQGFWNIGIPMMRFKIRPTTRNRDRALAALLTNQDEYWSPYLGDAIRYWKADFNVPPLVHPTDLAHFDAPVYIIAADRDLSFPGKPLIARSKELFSNLVGTHLLENCAHCPSFRENDRQHFTSVFETAIDAVSQNPDSVTS